MNLDRNSRIPRLIPSVDVRKLPLSAHEAFVLSRIDGQSRVDEIALITGLDDDTAYALLDRLVSLGAAEWKDKPIVRQGPNSAPPIPDQPVTKSAPAPPSQPATKSVPTPRMTVSESYAAQLGEEVDLEPARRREILDMYRRLDTVSYYEVLGVPRNADKKEIRAAYFELSKRFHPDSLFRKRLGAFKPKMEGIFNKLTEAYEALGKLKTRTKYDEYLAISEQTSDARYMLEAGETTAEEEAKRASEVPVPEQELPGISSFPPDEITLEHATLELDERKRLVQDRWRKALTQSPTAHANAPSVRAQRSPSSPAAAGRDLARSLAQIAGVTGGMDPVRRHMSSARLAEETGNLVEAVNFARLAQALAPERADIIKEHERLRLRLAAQLADSYEKQAEYEESHGKWQAAAMSWAQVCAGRPDNAASQLRAAEAYMRVGNDMRSAKSFAQKAADLSPNDAKAHVLLGRIFLALELKLNAKRELELALKMEPNNEVARALLDELSRTA
ncbi:MAG: DnaJ domain-containing protein [Sandaracinaceae bacterium]|nr:DnaJ domain-containing protein [Sandaracinaceae bacterium]